MDLEIDMSIASENDPSASECLSALADGELEISEITRACTAWREDGRSRACWHTYQLIGDVLRSEDLASHAARDAAFLVALRARMSLEPVVLAPDAATEPARQHEQSNGGVNIANAGRHSRWTWMAPSAVAAGFLLVTGALYVTRGPLPQGAPLDAATRSLAAGPLSSEQVAVAGSSPIIGNPPGPAWNRKILRDTNVDRYLAAHQQFAGTSALGVPSGFLRNAAAEAPNR
jgi:sigma-E factor negative regulatory protein RseA